MKVSIQIVNYNSRECLKECLYSIGKYKPDRMDVEVIVINNDAEPITEFLKGSSGNLDLRVVEINRNVGFGRAHNAGFKKTTGEYLLLLNPDTRMILGTLSAMAESFFQNESLGIVGPLLVDTQRRIQPGYCGKEKTPFSIMKAKLVEEKTEKEALEENGTANVVDWVAGTAMMIRRRAFEEIGGFDENYFMYFEDVDLCLQARKKKYLVAINPRAKIFHAGGQSFSSQRDKKRYYYASQDYYIRKNFGAGMALMVKAFRTPHYLKNVYFKK